MTSRLNEIFSLLPDCKVFADIGCDHGYVAKAMLDSGKCKEAIVSDISEKCLEKAKTLLKRYAERGVVKSVVSDGFEKVIGCDLALIAGMGGEEICSIIEKAKSLPEKLVIQPMKNCDKARLCLINSGYKIERDYIFKSAGKFYDLILAVKGKGVLTEEEILFGKDNLTGNNKAFKEMLSLKIAKLNAVLDGTSLADSARINIEKEVEKLKKYV